FSALGGGFLLFPIGDRRCNRTRASVGNAGGNARPSLTNATLAASRLLHRRSPLPRALEMEWVRPHDQYLSIALRGQNPHAALAGCRLLAQRVVCGKFGRCWR